ncbi:arginase family protein [Thermobifida halotolerans]|uniref:Arginase family protein n=1 Tax=Thermobifida halotolerans TaxID=483545 RepID=A0A399G6Z1_9ACTN|nr:arginase family protein [Thermobifida halotolerans]UOE21016.1 arginase family protein [Thermobifida halotolerans]
MWQRDMDLVVPLWQGGDDVRIAAGASALARLVPASGSRMHMAVSDGRRGATDGVCNLELVAQAVRQMRTRMLRRAPRRVLTLGGDCASDLAAIEHLARRHPGMVVYWVDAHADLNTPASSPTGRVHGMALRLLLGEGHPALLGESRLVPSQVTLVGARSADPGEVEFVRAARIDVVDTTRLTADPRSVVAGRSPGTPAYVHLDMDVCDPAELAAVACPTPMGPRVGSVAAALASITAHHDVVGVGVCEYTPTVEHDVGAVHTLLGALGLMEAEQATASR